MKRGRPSRAKFTENEQVERVSFSVRLTPETFDAVAERAFRSKRRKQDLCEEAIMRYLASSPDEMRKGPFSDCTSSEEDWLRVALVVLRTGSPKLQQLWRSVTNLIRDGEADLKPRALTGGASGQAA